MIVVSAEAENAERRWNKLRDMPTLAEYSKLRYFLALIRSPLTTYLKTRVTHHVKQPKMPSSCNFDQRDIDIADIAKLETTKTQGKSLAYNQLACVRERKILHGLASPLPHS